LSGIKPTNKALMQKLDEVGLADRADSKVKTFSQGMKQRLGIAVAMVHDPSLIILDEPTNGLDPQGIADMRRLIISLSRDQGKTVLVSSHLLTEMEQVASRMIIIDKGKKMVEGEVKELLDPSHVLLDIETLDQQASMIWIKGSRWGSLPCQVHQGIIQLKLDRQDISAFSRELVNAGADIVAINPRNSLEEYFLKITGRDQYAGADQDRAF
jgi:ABC-type multidrug transport system ATPase subunit